MFDWQDLKHFCAGAHRFVVGGSAGAGLRSRHRRATRSGAGTGARPAFDRTTAAQHTVDPGRTGDCRAGGGDRGAKPGYCPPCAQRRRSAPGRRAHQCAAVDRRAYLAPRIAEFNQAFPQIVVTLSGESALAELDRGEADIAVRMVRPQQPELLTQRIGMMRYALYAAPERAAFSPMTITTNSSRISNGCNSCCRGVRWSFRPAICFHCNKRRVQGWVPPFCRLSSPMAIRIWSCCPRPMPRQRASFGW